MVETTTLNTFFSLISLVMHHYCLNEEITWKNCNHVKNLNKKKLIWTEISSGEKGINNWNLEIGRQHETSEPHVRIFLGIISNKKAEEKGNWDFVSLFFFGGIFGSCLSKKKAAPPIIPSPNIPIFLSKFFFILNNISFWIRNYWAIKFDYICYMHENKRIYYVLILINFEASFADSNDLFMR